MRRRYMMATTAYHPPTRSDLSSSSPDLCIVTEKNKDFYIGQWVISTVGFQNVIFPRNTTRELTKSEKLEWDGKKIAYSGGISGFTIYTLTWWQRWWYKLRQLRKT